MRSTRLADVFYHWDINPFSVVAPLVFFIPISTYLLVAFLFGLSFFYALMVSCIVFLFFSIIFFFYFHRDPPREIQQDERMIVSPADGIVVYIKKIEQGSILESVKKKNHMRLTELLDVARDDVVDASGFIIGIEMRLFDVHITRSPITGYKLLDHHVSGSIVSMMNPDFEYINDRETVLLQTKDSLNHTQSSLTIAVVQIATWITRTVKSFVRDRADIVQGEPLGIIRLGSQVDLIIFSKEVNILVKEHDRVYAGITMIAERA